MFQNSYFYPYYMHNIPFTARGGFNPNLLNGITRGTARGLTNNLAREGLFSRIANSLGFARNINWGNFINNTSKTLGVINQTIPLVKQAGPMFRNVKSVLKLASVFKDETDPLTNKKTKLSINNNKLKPNNDNYSDNKKKIDENFNNQPTFFIN